MRFFSGLIYLSILAISPQSRGEISVSPESIVKAINLSLPLLNSAAKTSAKQRKCFTCHNQGLPILTFVEAKKRGFDIDAKNLNLQISHTATHLQRGKSNYLEGTGQGGKADTAGSALMALKATGYQRNEITDAVVEFLLQWSDDTPYWTAQSKRPPSEGSRFTSTYLALSGLEAYGFDQNKAAIQKRRKTAHDWLIKNQGKSTEDRTFRLLAMQAARVDKPQILKAIRILLELQRNDGGWAQLNDMDSDAYATGSALFALHQTGGLDSKSNAYQKGMNFLIDSQQKDGSWHVISRSRPIQEFYDSGFPHEKDQFISCSATAWATLALLLASPESP